MAALYCERWEIESVFGELKTHQRGPRAVLSSKTRTACASNLSPTPGPPRAAGPDLQNRRRPGHRPRPVLLHRHPARHAPQRAYTPGVFSPSAPDHGPGQTP
ncbi:hypothetical protein [Streptomyces sp. NBC_01283]|uniref:hypothetical protein n=1 Tax=Streptomyces sp. NBC_01283 TaxID=2903812 RepID=UPI00352E3268